MQYLHVSLLDFHINAYRGGDNEKPAIQQIHDRINGRLPLIGVGNLYTADQINKALNSGWAEFTALGKTAILNPDIGTLILENRENEIETELDLERKDKYNLGEFLWERAKEESPLLPPLKKK